MQEEGATSMRYREVTHAALPRIGYHHRQIAPAQGYMGQAIAVVVLR